MNDFHETILVLCRHNGINQNILAKMCGVTAATMSRYLTLQRDFSLDAFMAMCRVLDLRTLHMYRLYCEVRRTERKEQGIE